MARDKNVFIKVIADTLNKITNKQLRLNIKITPTNLLELFIFSVFNFNYRFYITINSLKSKGVYRAD
jgi:hypothetical protein